ncbi:hypothetical protein [Argonema antarcticum]|uniref:hypothetical protein n=1 Tax=Argonema antarcticum TaxID=2942763 RepID=UPI0020139D1F|nr:hypothetical protein [Argonema antarcticum]MCL1470180.1 hypothetical protein [Argonema antarcticum A004/B2]
MYAFIEQSWRLKLAPEECQRVKNWHTKESDRPEKRNKYSETRLNLVAIASCFLTS